MAVHTLVANYAFVNVRKITSKPPKKDCESAVIRKTQKRNHLSIGNDTNHISYNREHSLCVPSSIHDTDTPPPLN